MTTPTIQFRDSIGAVTITTLAPTLNNWTPDVDEICDRQVPQGTGIEEFWRYRRDFWASFEMSEIAATDLDKLHRLKSHLLTGGFITINTNDARSRVYTCSIKPGETPSWQFSDRANLKYTLSLAVRNVMPYPMICDYSSVGGTSGNLLTNGDGETGSDGDTATGWTNTTGDTLVIDTAQAYLGSASLLHANSALNTAQRAAQHRTLTPGQRYAYSAWIRLDGVAGDFAQILAFSNVDDANITPVFRHSPSFTAASGVISAGSVIDWTFVALLFDGPTTGDTQAVVTAGSTGVCSAWYDNVRLEAVPKV